MINPEILIISKPLQELLALKLESPHKIHLLVGNHDSSYMFRPSMCPARYDYLNDKSIMDADNFSAV